MGSLSTLEATPWPCTLSKCLHLSEPQLFLIWRMGLKLTPLSKLDLWSAAFHVNLTYICLKEDAIISRSATLARF